MRRLILAPAVFLLAGPAFADSSAVATYELTVGESCTFSTSTFTQTIVITGNTLSVPVTCNSEFDLSFTGSGAGGTIAVTNTSGTEVDGTDYSNTLTGTVTLAPGGGNPFTATDDGDGDFKADDGTATYLIAWSGQGDSSNTNGLASGDYSGTATLTLSAESP